MKPTDGPDPDPFGLHDADPAPNRAGIRRAAWEAAGWSPKGKPARHKTGFTFSHKNRRAKKKR